MSAEGKSAFKVSLDREGVCPDQPGALRRYRRDEQTAERKSREKCDHLWR